MDQSSGRISVVKESELLDYLYFLRNRGSKFGLERMQELVQRFKSPQLSYPTIHVAGTNGKGSVCAMLDSIYRAHGYKVGLFTSPHLLELGERVRVNGQILSFPKILNWVKKIRPVAEDMAKQHEQMYPSFFEVMTAVAFLEFQKCRVDIAIFETGLGGRLDSTNVIQPEISIITSIGLDHCEMLGNTLTEIASEKAGIFKKRTPALWGWLPEEANRVMEAVSQKLNCPVQDLSGLAKEELPNTNLSGSFQSRNAALARQAVQILVPKFPLTKAGINQALTQVSLAGRWQVVSGSPTMIFDACHNGAAVPAILENLKNLPQPVELWFASSGTERAGDVLPPILPYASRVRLFEIHQPGACTKVQMKKLIPDAFSGDVFLNDTKEIPSLINSSTPDHTILVTGSLYFIGEVFSVLKNSDMHNCSNFQDIW